MLLAWFVVHCLAFFVAPFTCFKSAVKRAHRRAWCRQTGSGSLLAQLVKNRLGKLLESWMGVERAVQVTV